MRYARVVGGVVVEIVETDADIAKLYHPIIVASMLPCSDDVRQGDRYDGSGFSKPPAPVARQSGRDDAVTALLEDYAKRADAPQAIKDYVAARRR